jgi:hypothetical protein
MLAALFVAAPSGAGGSAAALSADALCASATSFTETFNPALTGTAQTIATRRDTTYSCTVGATSGASTVSGNETLTCAQVTNSLLPQDEVVTWAGGAGAATSTFHYTSVTAVSEVATLQGTVTSGRFSGDSATLVLSATGFSGTNSLECPLGLGGLVTMASGGTTLTVTHP